MEKTDYQKYLDEEQTFSLEGTPYLSKVRDQEDCGCCWAFAALAVMASTYAANRKDLYDLSPQHALDDVPYTVDDICCRCGKGCMGYSAVRIMTYLRDMGVVEESVHKYEASRLEEPTLPTGMQDVMKVGSFRYLYILPAKGNKGDEQYRIAKKHIAKGYPLMALISAGPKFDDLMKDDVYKAEYPSPTDDKEEFAYHAIVLIGYAMIEGQKCYRFMNSHGIEFCDNGYGYVSFDSVKGVMAVFDPVWDVRDINENRLRQNMTWGTRLQEAKKKMAEQKKREKEMKVMQLKIKKNRNR